MKIILVMAVTVDGKIAKGSDHFPDWTSLEDKRLFAEVSKKAGMVLMGEKTFATFPSPLPNRLNVVFTMEQNPKSIEGVKWVSGDPEPVLEELEKMGYTEAVLGGGAFLNSMFLERKLVDEIMITIEPKIFGSGLSLFSKEIDAELKLIEVKKINDDSVVLRYQVIK